MPSSGQRSGVTASQKERKGVRLRPPIDSSSSSGPPRSPTPNFGVSAADSVSSMPNPSAFFFVQVPVCKVPRIVLDQTVPLVNKGLVWITEVFIYKFSTCCYFVLPKINSLKGIFDFDNWINKKKIIFWLLHKI